MSDFDPFAFAERQIELDRDAVGHTTQLLRQKKFRLSPSPHGFLRGSAPLFYEILKQRPDLAKGPTATGWIVGDMHLENVGAYRNDDDEVVFDLNDFDDATIGPLHLDVLRLSTSVLLAGRGFCLAGARSIELVERLVGAYLAARSGGAALAEPDTVHDLVHKVKNRSRQDLLDKRAPLDANGNRHFARGSDYLDLPPDVVARVPDLLAAYVAALGPRAPGKAANWDVEDAAQRVAGNGSLGVLRVAVLVRDKLDDERLIELKECRASSTEALFAPHASFPHHGARVVQGARALLPALPRHLAAFQGAGRSFAGRRLFPQEDKLALDKRLIDQDLLDEALVDKPALEAMQHVAGDALGALVPFIGNLLGAAHARGVAALGAPAADPWTDREIAAIVHQAIELAGMMEGIYLAWVRKSG